MDSKRIAVKGRVDYVVRKRNNNIVYNNNGVQKKKIYKKQLWAHYFNLSDSPTPIPFRPTTQIRASTMHAYDNSTKCALTRILRFRVTRKGRVKHRKKSIFSLSTILELKKKYEFFCYLFIFSFPRPVFFWHVRFALILRRRP